LKNPIRTFAAIGSVAAGLGAVIAIALLPETALAHEWNGPDSKPASGQTLAQALAALSPECQTTVQALADWRVNDRREDMDEKLSQQSPTFDDVNEDKQERATVMGLWDKIRAACAPQVTTAGALPSDACVAAKQQFKDAVTAQFAREKAERANGTEGNAADATNDKQEAAHLKALWDAKHAACGWSFQKQSANFAGWENGFHRR
jgi:ABC-type transport system involved in cytochrome bd biosynthesis fused ATPase/permease subunit